MDKRKWSFLDVESPLPRVLRISLDRPPVNALGADLVRQLTEAASAAASDGAFSCVLLAARGRAFCAGADLKERAGMSDEDALAAVRGIRAMVEQVAAIPIPTVAVIQGAALGGGLELALACDLRVAAEDAPVGLPECSLAIIPGAGGTRRLAQLAGPGAARRWIYTGRTGLAAEAHRDGFIEIVVPALKLEATALALAADIARCGPLALRAAKKALDGRLLADAGVDAEWDAYLSIVDTEDRREALRAFAEKRPPKFEGR